MYVYVYAEPGEVIIDDISENDKADKKATIPDNMKEIITAGPAYRPAAFPLNE